MLYRKSNLCRFYLKNLYITKSYVFIYKEDVAKLNAEQERKVKEAQLVFSAAAVARVQKVCHYVCRKRNIIS